MKHKVASYMRLAPVARNLVRVRQLERASSERLDEHQDRLLRELVMHAYKTVPFYRERLDAGVVKGFSGRGDLAKLPTLTRTHLQDTRSEDILAAGFDEINTRASPSSGSTGVPVVVRNSEHDLGYLRASFLSDLVSGGIRPWDRVAYFKRKAFLHHRWERFGLLPSFHIATTDSIANQVDSFLAAQPTFVCGFPNMIVYAVDELRRRGVAYDKVRAAVVGGEKLSDGERQRIEDYFGAPCLEVYASVEMFTMARSCTKGRLHVRRCDVVLEVEHDDGSTSIEDGEGELLVTRLHSEAMPLLRYRLGDRVSIRPNDCDCGSYATPIVSEVIGRKEDPLVGLDGRTVNSTFLSLIVGGFKAVRRLQIHHAPGFAEVLVMTDEPDENLLAEILTSLENALPGFAVKVRRVDRIAPEPNGKLKVIKRMSFDNLNA